MGSRGARPSLLVAAVALVVSAAMLTRLTPGTSTGYLVIAYVIFGFAG